MSLQTEKLEISPARYQLLDELADRGYETYVFINGHLKQRKQFTSICHVINVRTMSNKEIRNKIRDISPQVVIASTYEDMDAIYFLPWCMKKTAFYYYNLEIYTLYMPKEQRFDEWRIHFRSICLYLCNKTKEIIYTKKIEAFTIQDEMRKQISAKYHISHKNTLLIPNSYTFDDTKIRDNPGEGVIYTGAVLRWALSEQLDELVRVKNIPLTLAGWIDPAYKKQIDELKETNSNITFVEQQLSPEEHTRYLQKYAVGLIWYGISQDENIRYMGLSSGKMFKYLSMGKPVIAVKCPGITNEIRKYKIGIVINSISQLEDAYCRIMKKYAYYQKNVIETYKKIYDYKLVIQPFLDYIDNNLR